MNQLPRHKQKNRKRQSQKPPVRQIRLSRTREEWIALTKRAREVEQMALRRPLSEG